jgi:pimeloyl-ACP methyl ester carboxylesterase
MAFLAGPAGAHAGYVVNVVAGIKKTIISSAALTCLVLSSVLSASGCAGNDGAATHESTPATGRPLDGDFTDSGTGSLKAADNMPDIDPRLAAVTSLAARITYTSTSGINDNKYEVTGTVFVPKGDPPAGGWPTVAFGHRATGIRSKCAPSLSPTLLGESATVTELVKAGFVVAVPDYQGLGLNTTYHPFLDSTTEGYNLIDSMSAIRRLVPDTSDKWIAFGIGQGGQAAWAANELVENHGMGLNLVGAVSVSPISDIEGLADAAAAGGLTTDQKLTLLSFLAALKNTYRDDVNLDDYRRGAATENWDALLACDVKSSDERARLASQISADDLRPRSPDGVDSLHRFLQKTTLPQGPTSAPMLVVYGGRDALIPHGWTDRALDRACKMGDVIQIEFQPDRGGDDIGVSEALGWINDRLKGTPTINDCESFTAADESPRAGG